MATGGKIPSYGDTTPEHNAVRKSRGEIEPAIVRDDFIRQVHSRGLIPTRNPSSPPLDVVLDEISRDPVNYYSLQHVVTTLNVGGRFNDGISKMEKTFQCKNIIIINYEMHDDNDIMTYMRSWHWRYDFTVEMRKYIPAGPSEDPQIEPGTCMSVG